ncbi:PREDICTED: myeloma-overexpressed gene 2 protein [Miniopterus natalensis]|uniref:myeloma-overexpressed gene 2 protein n=1 Tax=Miniopterus natalensis TaxID=291302 RepID=UPI0007A6B96E|nr:PREDICTED: myeloma-overexpressed gene 2 protein [Miniopterus natalensis]
MSVGRGFLLPRKAQPLTPIAPACERRCSRRETRRQHLQAEAGGSTGLLMDLAANEKAVHADFFNDFEDLFDDDDIQ